MDQFAPEIITVDKAADGVSCDGGGGALGHPKVWYSFDGQDMVECGYCDRLFVKEGASVAVRQTSVKKAVKKAVKKPVKKAAKPKKATPKKAATKKKASA